METFKAILKPYYAKKITWITVNTTELHKYSISYPVKEQRKKMELNDDGRITRSLSTALSFAVLIIWNKIIFIYWYRVAKARYNLLEIDQEANRRFSKSKHTL